MKPENVKEYPEVPTGKIPVNIILGKFQPISDSVITVAREVYNQTGVATVLVIVATKKPNAVNPFPSDKLSYHFSNLLSTGAFPFIRGFITVKNADITDFVQSLRAGGMEPVSWSTMDDRHYKAYSKICKDYGKKAGLIDAFEVSLHTVNPDITEKMARLAISEYDYEQFLKVTPFRKMGMSESRKLFDNLCVMNAEALNGFKF